MLFENPVYFLTISKPTLILQGEKKKKSKVVELGMDVDTDGNSASQVQLYLNDELKMIQSDLNEKERVDAKNTLEEFVYEMRDKLQVSRLLYSLFRRKLICHSFHRRMVSYLVTLPRMTGQAFAIN